MGNAAINQPKPVLLLDKVSSWSFILGENVKIDHHIFYVL